MRWVWHEMDITPLVNHPLGKINENGSKLKRLPGDRLSITATYFTGLGKISTRKLQHERADVTLELKRTLLTSPSVSSCLSFRFPNTYILNSKFKTLITRLVKSTTTLCKTYLFFQHTHSMKQIRR
jgi:hypothetical protein